MFFKASEIDQSREPLSTVLPGLYRVSIGAVTLKTTKNNDGKFLEFTYQIVAPLGVNSKVWESVTVENMSPIAKEIGLKRLGDIIVACGLDEIESIEALQQVVVGKEILLETYLETDDGKDRVRVTSSWNLKGGHRNKIRSLKEVILGPNGKKAVPGKARGFTSPTVTSVTKVFSDDLPF